MTTEESPSAATPESRYSITNNISYMYQVYCSYMMVFKNPDPSKEFMPPTLLKESLKNLTRNFYKPVSGWFETVGDEIDVVFSDTEFNDPPLEIQMLDTGCVELREYVRSSNEDLLVPRGPSSLITKENKRIPMFLAKASYLTTNEAMVLGVTYHHSLMDGSAFWLFMYNWASLAKQMHARNTDGHTDRICENFVLPCPPTFGFPSIAHLHEPEKQFSHSEYTLVDSSDCLRAFVAGPDPIKENILRISVEQQHSIREMARKYGVSFTAMLCAMFWHETSILRLNARPSVGPATSLFTCAVNPRASIGVSSFLCASPVINLAEARTIGEIASMELGQVAQLVSETITKGTAAYVSSSMDFLVKHRREECENERLGKEGKKIMLAYVCPLEAKCTVSSSRNFPIYQCDFGSGSPVYVRPPFLPFDGCLRVWPTPEACGTGLTNKEAVLEVYLSQPGYVDLSLSPLLGPFVSSEAPILDL
ncbi:hypothetical protein GGI07_005242 [Coemansia sp. Benny D115]|nr:hypothetical protein GGI07_005242 [Coemansia sp. Benny D115]